MPATARKCSVRDLLAAKEFQEEGQRYSTFVLPTGRRFSRARVLGRVAGSYANPAGTYSEARVDDGTGEIVIFSFDTSTAGLAAGEVVDAIGRPRAGRDGSVRLLKELVIPVPAGEREARGELRRREVLLLTRRDLKLFGPVVELFREGQTDFAEISLETKLPIDYVEAVLLMRGEIERYSPPWGEKKEAG